MKKGFTLIELLAVIVILAVIAIIATPIILNIIEDSKKQSAIDSAQLYVDGLGKYILNKNMTREFMPSNCVVDGSEVSCGTEVIDYSVSGKKPSSGYINYNNGIVSSYELCVMDYKVGKTQTGVTAVKSSECSQSNESNAEVLTWDGTSVSTGLSGCGVEANPYIINLPADLAYMRNQVNNGGNITTTSTCTTKIEKASDAYYKQTVNIALNDTTNYNSWNESTTGLNSWEPIGKYIWDTSTNTETINSFTGYYDGDNHSISGIYISSENDNRGLFGYTGSVTIKNLNIKNSFVKGGNTTGVLIGNAAKPNVIIDKVNVTAKLIGTGDVGGLIGAIYSYEGVGDASITNSRVNGTIYGTYAVAGFVGYYYAPNSESSISFNNLINNATISKPINSATEANAAGGIAGYIYTVPVTITNVVNNGSITGIDGAGGIVGLTNSPSLTITNSINHGNLKHNIQRSEWGDNGVGGLIAQTNNSTTTITNCYNDGNVEGINFAGGLVAYATAGLTEVSNSYNTGVVKTIELPSYNYDYSGGLIGRVEEVAFSNSYNTGDVYGHMYVGGLIGCINNQYSSTATSTNSFYNSGNIYVSDNNAIQNNMYVGGLIGKMSSTANIDGVYNSGNITVSTNPGSSVFGYVSGVVGYIAGGSMQHTYNSGNIIVDESNDTKNSTYHIAGLATDIYMNQNYNIGNITVSTSATTTNYVSGIVYTLSSSAPTQNSHFKGLINVTGNGTNNVSTIMTYRTGGTYGNVYNSANSYPIFIYNESSDPTSPGQSLSASDMATVLSVVNNTGNKYKAGSDDNHPILIWQ